MDQRYRAFISIERTAFIMAPSKLLEMDMTSPVAFICVPSDVVRIDELVKRPARELDDHVVQRRLKAGVPSFR